MFVTIVALNQAVLFTTLQHFCMLLLVLLVTFQAGLGEFRLVYDRLRHGFESGGGAIFFDLPHFLASGGDKMLLR